MYQSLYRKYRPKNFDQVVGQDVIVKTLTNAINNNQVAHAYLFEGPRGTGKTSIAKIFAKSINCVNLNNNIPCDKCVSCTQILNNNSLDIREIDAASSNSVENVREIISNCDAVPSYSKYKIYIIDEVHMFSIGAFNSLLKTLEEPPKHVIFILATTDPQKIPSTIVSRCQVFEFKKISEDVIYKRLLYICKEEDIDATDSALYTISHFANGGLRDAIGMLEQVVAYKTNNITEDDVHMVNGTLTKNDLIEFIDKVFKKDISQIFELIDKYDNDGKNLTEIINEIIVCLTNCVLIQKADKYVALKNINISEYEQISKIYSYDEISHLLINMNEIYQRVKNGLNSKLIFELELIKIFNAESTLSCNKEVKELQIKPKKTVNIIKPKVETLELENSNNKFKLVNEDMLKQFKDIRVNNTLCQFNKDEFKNLKNNINKVNSLLLDKQYSDVCTLVLDGKIKAASEKNIVFVYEDSVDSDSFNSHLPYIESLINKIFEKDYAVIALTEQEWLPYKEKFNKKEKFEFKEDSIKFDDVYQKTESKNNIEKLFNNLIKEEK